MLGGLDTSMSECSALTPRINSGKPRHDTHRSTHEPVSGIVKGLVINAMVCACAPRGIGAAVLSYLNAAADRLGLPVFLYTANLRNVKFYQAHGYELCKQRELPAGGDHEGPFDATVFSLRRPAKQ